MNRNDLKIETRDTSRDRVARQTWQTPDVADERSSLGDLTAVYH